MRRLLSIEVRWRHERSLTDLLFLTVLATDDLRMSKMTRERSDGRTSTQCYGASSVISEINSKISKSSLSIHCLRIRVHEF